MPAINNAKIDANYRRSLLGVLDDVSQLTYPVQVNPVTKRLLVSAVVTSNNTGIGNTIPGGTAGSVLFLGAGSTLAQDNANFFYDDTSHFLGIGTDTPNANLHVAGSVEFDLGGDAPGDVYYRGSGGQLVNLGIGSAGQVLTVSGGLLPEWSDGGGGGGGYDTIQNQGTSVTQESTINLTNLLTASDVAGKTQLTVNTANLGNDATLIGTLTSNSTFLNDIADSSAFIGYLLANTAFTTDLAQNSNFVSTLVANTTFTNDLANNSNFWNTLANNASFISALTGNSTFQGDVVTIVNTDPSVSVSLTSQVTGTLPIANGGTGSSTKAGAFDNLSPLSSKGDLVVYSGSDNVRLPVGTNGQVLVSNSSAANGVDWETPSTGTINPAVTSYLFDDFVGGGGFSGSSPTIGELGWKYVGAGSVSYAGTASHPGAIVIAEDGSGTAGIALNSFWASLNVPNTTLEFLVKLSTTTGQAMVGLSSAASAQSPTGTMAVVLSSGNWEGRYSGLSGNTSVGSVAATTGWTKLKLVTDGTGANVTFYVNGTSMGSLSTDSYSGNVFPVIHWQGAGATSISADYFFLSQTLSR